MQAAIGDGWKDGRKLSRCPRRANPLTGGVLGKVQGFQAIGVHRGIAGRSVEMARYDLDDPSRQFVFPHAPQRTIALLDLEPRQPAAFARTAEAFPRLRAVARPMVAADQCVVVVVEEVRVAEIERQALMPADVEVGVATSPIADRKR